MKKTFWSTLLIATAISTSAGAQTIFEALSSAYETNPTLLAQRAYLRSVDENVAIAKSGFRPTMALQGSYTDSSVDSNIAPKNQDNDKTIIAANISQPLFNGFATVNSVKSADSTVRAQQIICIMLSSLSSLTLLLLIWMCCKIQPLSICKKITKSY